MSSKKLTSRETGFEAVMERAMLVAGTSKWSEIAVALDMSSGDLANRKKRNTLPYDRLIDFAHSRKVSVDWLLTGTGPMRHVDGGGGETALSPREQAVLSLFRALDEGAQREIQEVASEKKRLRDIEQKLEQLSAQLARRKTSP
jgi:hypothetical protein